METMEDIVAVCHSAISDTTTRWHQSEEFSNSVHCGLIFWILFDHLLSNNMGDQEQ